MATPFPTVPNASLPLPLASSGALTEASGLQTSRLNMNIDEITQRLHAIRDSNDWQRFHSPKNLAMAASVEMAELVEIFQWLDESQSRQLTAPQLEHAGQEVGDILMYLLLMCSELGIDMEQALLAKLADNERRFAR